MKREKKQIDKRVLTSLKCLVFDLRNFHASTDIKYLFFSSIESSDFKIL